MADGYVFRGGEQYACDEICRDTICKDVYQTTWEYEYDDEGDSYWTEFEDDYEEED